MPLFRFICRYTNIAVIAVINASNIFCVNRAKKSVVLTVREMNSNVNFLLLVLARVIPQVILKAVLSAPVVPARIVPVALKMQNG